MGQNLRRVWNSYYKIRIELEVEKFKKKKLSLHFRFERVFMEFSTFKYFFFLVRVMRQLTGFSKAICDRRANLLNICTFFVLMDKVLFFIW